MKVCEKCGVEIYTRDGENQCGTCETDAETRSAKAKERRAKAKRQRAAMNDVMESLGLKKVRGAMGGTYWE